MDTTEIIVWLVLILVADVAAMVLYDWYKKKKNKRLDNTKCDDCGKVRRTKKTPDRRHWLCRECMKIYKLENSGGE